MAVGKVVGDENESQVGICSVFIILLVDLVVRGRFGGELLVSA